MAVVVISAEVLVDNDDDLGTKSKMKFVKNYHFSANHMIFSL